MFSLLLIVVVSVCFFLDFRFIYGPKYSPSPSSGKLAPIWLTVLWSYS